MENNPEVSGSDSRFSVLEKLSYLRSRNVGLAVFLFLIIMLPVITYVVKQQTQTQQKAQQWTYDQNDPTKAQKEDCYPQIQYPITNSNTWQNEDVTRYQNAPSRQLSKDQQTIVSIPVNTDFYMSFNLLSSSHPDLGINPLTADKTAIIWWRNAYHTDGSSNIIGLAGAASVQKIENDAFWNSTSNQVGSVDMLTIARMHFTRTGDYEVSFKTATSFDPSNPSGAAGSCSNANDANGWVTRKIRVVSTNGGQAAGNALQTLVNEDGATGKIRRCALNTAAQDALGVFATCESNWTDFNLASGDTWRGYDSFSYVNGNSTYAIQTLVHQDGRTAKLRKCTMNPSANDAISILGTCDNWVEFNLPPGDSYRSYDVMVYNNGATLQGIQTLVHGDGRTAMLRRCSMNAGASDPLSVFASCDNDWTQFNLAPGDSYRSYDSFSYINGSSSHAVQTLVHQDGRTAKLRKCTMNPSSSDSLGVFGTCDSNWTEINLLVGNSYRSYDTLVYNGTGAPIPTAPSAGPTIDPNTPIACAAHIFKDQNGDGDIKVGEEVSTRPVQFKVGERFAYGFNLERPATTGEEVRIEWGNNSRGNPASTLGTPFVENGSSTNTRRQFTWDNGTYFEEGNYTIKAALKRGSAIHCFGGSQDIAVTVQEFAPTPPPQHTTTSCILNIQPNFGAVAGQTSIEAQIEYGRLSLENEQTTINWGCSGQAGCDPETRVQVGSSTFTRSHVYTQPGVYTITASLKHLTNGNATELCTGSTLSKTITVRAPIGGGPTAIPTVEPTRGPSVAPTVAPTQPPITITVNPTGPTVLPTSTGNVQLNFSLLVQGVGARTNRYPEEIFHNPNPVNAFQTRQLEIEVFNAQNSRVANTTTPITYNTSTGRYTGTANLGQLSPSQGNQYTVRVKTDGYLRRPMGLATGSLILVLPPGTHTINGEILSGGDVNNDSVLNILDYYRGFEPCFKKAITGQCKNSDFNADSNIDLTDHKLIYDNIKNGIQF